MTGTPVVPAPKERATRVALESVLGVIIGIVGEFLLFRWVLIDSFQSVNLPSLPLNVRYALAFGLWLLTAAILGLIWPRGGWRWGLRLAIPVIAVNGIVILLDFGGDEGNLSAAIIAGVLLAGCVGGVVGGRLRALRIAPRA